MAGGAPTSVTFGFRLACSNCCAKDQTEGVSGCAREKGRG
jgi:hypothetical protein